MQNIFACCNRTLINVNYISKNIQAWVQCPISKNIGQQSPYVKAARSVVTMKRKRSSASDDVKSKASKTKEPDYHLTPSIKDASGENVWPAPKEQMAKARELILEW